MRLAYISDTYLPEFNGIVTAMVRHTEKLAERGHETLVLCPRYGDNDPAGPAGSTVVRYRSWSAASNANTRVSVPAFRDIARQLRLFRPDVVHVHTPLTLGVAGVVVARALRIPLVETYHSWVPGFMQYASLSRLLGIDKGPRRTRDTMPSRLFTHLVYNPADLLLAPSEVLAQMLRDAALRPPARYQTNGIDLDEFPPKDGWHLRKRIMHCGRLGFEKNAEVVLHAFSGFLHDHPEWELHLLGEGPAEPYLRSLINRLGIARSVRFEGFVSREHLSEAYRECDLYATASTIETQGLVVLEAQASGTPVVGVDALAVPEMARHGVSGIIVRPYDAQAMAEAFRALADDGALRERFGRAGIHDVRAHDLESAVDRLERTYGELLALAPGRTRGYAWQQDTGSQR